eukprot:scpid63240/ scgid8856/ 
MRTPQILRKSSRKTTGMIRISSFLLLLRLATKRRSDSAAMCTAAIIASRPQTESRFSPSGWSHYHRNTTTGFDACAESESSYRSYFAVHSECHCQQPTVAHVHADSKCSPNSFLDERLSRLRWLPGSRLALRPGRRIRHGNPYFHNLLSFSLMTA